MSDTLLADITEALERDDLTEAEIDSLLSGLEAMLAAEYDWTLQPRQQVAEDFLADLNPDQGHELLYGGAVGGGKSDFLLWHHYHLAQQYPGYRGLIIRRTFRELARTLIRRSFETFDRSLCKWNGVDKMWRFANGSTIELGYCVGPDTRILMGDGSYRRMADVREGDYVGTLEGPRRVKRHWHVGTRAAVEITLPGCEPVIASATHEVLDITGAWRVPESLSRADRSGDRAGQRSRRGSLRHRPRSFHAGLHAPAARQAVREARDSARRSARGRVLTPTGLPGLWGGYPTGTRSDDARTRPVREADQERTPSQADADTWSDRPSRVDGPTRARSRSPWGAASYRHPYTKETRSLAVDVLPGRASIARAGEQDLWDMSVEGANHYVSYGGMVHKNCESETDVYQYQSAEYDVISFDELTQWPSDFAYTYLFSRIRTRAHLTAAGLVGHMVSGTNPGNVGGVWVKKRFIDEGAEMRQIELADPTSDLVTTRCFVPAKMGDNRHINKRQYRAMLTNLAPALRAQLEDGSWDVVEGMYFPEWERRIHVMSPFEIPSNWPRIRCLDYGYTNPMACYWIAFDQDGTGYAYRELYGTGMTPIIQARRILELTPPRENVDYTVADPSIWTKTGVGPPIASQFRAAGLNTRKANNARIDGWARVREFLRVDEQLGRPKLYVFSTCQNLIRTLPMMVHDKTHPEDLDTRSEDHAVDALRYGLMSRPRTIVTPRREAITLEERIAESHRRKRGFESRMVHPDLGRI